MVIPSNETWSKALTWNDWVHNLVTQILLSRNLVHSCNVYLPLLNFAKSEIMEEFRNKTSEVSLIFFFLLVDAGVFVVLFKNEGDILLSWEGLKMDYDNRYEFLPR